MQITYIAKARLTPLWELVKTCGSQQAAARLIGINPSEFSNWLSLSSYPREIDDRRRYPDREDVISNVALYCGATMEEIWPAELRAAIDEKRIVREAERVVDVEPGTLIGHSSSPPNAQLMLESQERKDLIMRSLKMLSYRQREVLKLRYGLGDGIQYSLDDVAKVFRVTKERIRQIEMKAIAKLQNVTLAAGLVDYCDGLSSEE
jgi:RNA polymerase sigma factor (sigma-70 family)